MRALVVVCALLGVAHADDLAAHADEIDPEARFAAAIADEAHDVDHAVRELRALATTTTSVAPDALTEACTLDERRLFNLPAALACWRELAARFPDGRGAAHARARMDALAIVEAVAPADRRALADFEAIVDGTPAPALRTRVRELLAAHPALPVRSRAHAWLAQADERAGDLDDALAEDELAQHDDRAWAARALRDEAALLVRMGRLDDAATAYDRLALFDDPVARLAVTGGRHALRVARWMRVLTWVAWAWLALFVVVGVGLARRSLWPPPREVRFLAPVALLFVGGAAFEQRAIVVAVAMIALGSVVIAWLAGAARRISFALAASLAVLALAFVATRGNDLLGLVVETMRAGPER